MKQALMDWLTQQAAACEARRASLAAEGRGDEATFERIRYNVYDLFCTTVGALHRAEPEERSAWQLFERRLSEIPSAWQRSLDMAELHGDTAKAHIERVKLEAAEAIRQRYEALRGDGA